MPRTRARYLAGAWAEQAAVEVEETRPWTETLRGTGKTGVFVEF